ncbi:hypothetical protein NIES4072_72700 [Nostoc commune NIES-4072]|uniref:Uncharacterized protein n=2 Tax=Nostoc commune TaxID=1178 RepID=A0A2R5G1G5_NOSCO|nr:hypothetical protein NIES4070_72670 [Nostoc commune HK-02]GBG23558.1 hypothetical protein NIES4072_72700 [Nostoc commune NIES-4072]
MLSGITRSNLTINEQKILVLEELFWNDICSEYDADNLSKFLNNSDLNFSPEFKVFEKVWRRDERNHYVESAPVRLAAVRLSAQVCLGTPVSKHQNSFLARQYFSFADFAPLPTVLSVQLKMLNPFLS